jgi:monofunctional biosynthetic peptidoglycan transglycosylase
LRFFRFALLAAAAGAALPAAYVLRLPDVRPLKSAPPRTTAYMDLRRQQAGTKGRRLNIQWTWVPDDAISENLKNAVVTSEDDAFYRHDGVDMEALRAAWERDKKEGRFSAGGSTIPMQLARNLYLSPSKNPLRKVKEMLIARRLVKTLGRRRVLELYLNVVEWGHGVFGCEAAARGYFGKACADLTPDEAVAMAAVLPNPRRWDPSKAGPYVTRNSARIAARMAASGLWPQPEEAALDDSVSTAAIVPAPPGVSLSTDALPGPPPSSADTARDSSAF